MVDYLTEIFPIDVSKIGHLAAFDIILSKGHTGTFIDDLLIRLNKAFSGHWIWSGRYIITDSAPSPVQMEITLDVLRNEFPLLFNKIEAIEERTNWHPSAEDAAIFITRYCDRHYDDAIRQVLRQHGTKIHNGYVMRDYIVNGWEVDGQPALSFSVKPRLLYLQNVQATLEQGIDVPGLQVIDKTNARNIGIISKIEATVQEKRQTLLQHNLSDAMQQHINEADDSCKVVTVNFGEYQRDYVATALNIILSSDDYERFGINADSVAKASDLPPSEMAKLVSGASEVLKIEGFIGNAYNNRANPQHFIYLEHMPEMEFGNKKVRPYNIEALPQDFIANGLFSKHPRFKDSPIKIAVINALDSSIATDFIEAMRRQLEKDFGLEIEMIKERTVRVVSESNLASAVRVVEKENPHVLIACFADNQSASFDYVHSLTLGKGIALEALYEGTMNDPESMGRVIMGVLAKTGNSPFVLAEPLESANLVVGLDWVREKLTRGDRLAGMSRIYRRDGFFMRYFLDIQELESDENPPESMIATLFPAPIFKGKQVMIQHQGKISQALFDSLRNHARTIDCDFIIVEIHTETVPHLYALDNGVMQPPAGSVFLLNPVEAFVVSSRPDGDGMPENLHIRIRYGDITIEQAVYAVLALTLLNYSTTKFPRLPVTIRNAKKLAGWMGRGMLPDNINGDVPFWL